MGCPRFDGFSTGVGAPAGLCALLVVTLAAACLARPRSSFGAMLGQSALSTAYFGIAVGVRAPLDAANESRILQQHFHYAYGTYVGLAGTALLLLVALATPLRAHISGTPANLAALVLAGALLVAVLLPWLRYDRSTSPGLLPAPGVAVAALATLTPLAYWRSELLLLAAALLLLVAGSISVLVFPASREYGAWLGLGLAGTFALVALYAEWPRTFPFPREALPVVVVASFCLVSLFLPWQRTCFERNVSFGVYSGRCLAANAWSSLAAPAAALLVLAVVLFAVIRSPVGSATAALGVAAFAATLGFALEEGSGLGERAGVGYGASVGFAAFAALVAIVLARIPPAVGPTRTVECAPPMLGCIVYVALVLLPSWQVLSPDVDQELRFGPFSWLTVAGVVMAIHLLARWARRLRGRASRDPLLVVLPGALLALTGSRKEFAKVS